MVFALVIRLVRWCAWFDDMKWVWVGWFERRRGSKEFINIPRHLACFLAFRRFQFYIHHEQNCYAFHVLDIIYIFIGF